MSSEVIHLKLFRHPCTRCGYCCTVEPCPIAQEFHAPAEGNCPYLEIGDGDKASCVLMAYEPKMKTVMGVGAGCCMKARCMTPDGDVYDFSGLDPLLKRAMAISNQKTQGAIGRNKWGQPFVGPAPSNEREQAGTPQKQSMRVTG